MCTVGPIRSGPRKSLYIQQYIAQRCRLTVKFWPVKANQKLNVLVVPVLEPLDREMVYQAIQSVSTDIIGIDSPSIYN